MGGPYELPPPGLQTYPRPYPGFVSDGERGRWLSATDIVEVHDVRGVWALVSLDGEIVGWVDGQRLRPLGAPGPSVAVTPRDRLPAPLTVRSRAIEVSFDGIVAGLASIAIVIGALLRWTRGTAGVTSFKIPTQFLFDNKTAAQQPRIGWLLLGMSVVAFGLSFVRTARMWRALLGFVAAAMVALFCVQLAREVAHTSSSFTDHTGPGVLVTGISAFVLFVSPVVATRRGH